jgi:hypothetical protein
MLMKDTQGFCSHLTGIACPYSVGLLGHPASYYHGLFIYKDFQIPLFSEIAA